jgi:hypothetical protein
MKKTIAGLAAFLLLAACGSESQTGGDLPVITVFGAIEAEPTRAAMDPDVEPLFAQYGLVFEAAAELSWPQLAALEQHRIDTDFPAGGPVRHFSGPLLRDVMDLIRPREEEIVVTALDGYQRSMARMTLDVHDVILAIRLDGDPIPLGGFGPAMIVWPRAQDQALNGMPDDDWVWGVFAIEVRAESAPLAP